ncbi:MAG: LPS export ABC transporter periplasmic protein LptC [Bacteroidota bacterium]
MKRFFLYLLFVCVYMSCTEEEQASTPVWLDEEQLPMESFGVTYYFSDSAHVRAILQADHVIEKTEPNEEGEMELKHYFDQGVEIEFFDDKDVLESTVRANQGVFRKDKGIAELTGDVVVTNTKDERLLTEQLFWDKTIDSVYTYKPVRIETPEEIITGSKGLRSNTTFTTYYLFGIQGVVSVEEEGGGTP